MKANLDLCVKFPNRKCNCHLVHSTLGSRNAIVMFLKLDMNSACLCIAVNIFLSHFDTLVSSYIVHMTYIYNIETIHIIIR